MLTLALIVSRLPLMLLLIFAASATLYLAVAIWAVLRFRRGRTEARGALPAVTILKPVCGLDHGMEENLRSFCEQDYPHYRVIFGVRDPRDPALPLLRRLAGEYPKAQVVLDERVHGQNLKVSNLINMMPAARHDVIVIADSDMRVGRDYLYQVAMAFADPAVGAVTCLYRAAPVGPLSSTLGAMFINGWFFPSVLVALSFQELRFCFGATMAARRTALEAIGGLAALAPYLADDYMLGNLVSARGYKVRLAPCIVENVVHEPTLGSLFAHELRWARTVRACQPAGYAFSFISSSAITLAALAAVATRLNIGALGLLGAALALRLALHAALAPVTGLGTRGWAPVLLIPLRDLMGLVIWGASYCGKSVRWRAQRFEVQAEGRLAAKSQRSRVKAEGSRVKGERSKVKADS